MHEVGIVLCGWTAVTIAAIFQQLTAFGTLIHTQVVCVCVCVCVCMCVCVCVCVCVCGCTRMSNVLAS